MTKGTTGTKRRPRRSADAVLRERIFALYEVGEGLAAGPHIDAMDQIFKWIKSGALPPPIARTKIRAVQQTTDSSTEGKG